MIELTLKVQVSVGITPALENLLTRLMAPGVEANLARIRESEKSIEADNAYLNALKASQGAPAEPVAETPAPTPAPAEPVAEAPATEPTPEPEYDAAYVRQALDRTRRRIEGENYKLETTSELYKKYHKPLTALFKSMAMQLSAGDAPTEKPTELSPEKRKAFCEACEDIFINESGELECKIPF